MIHIYDNFLEKNEFTKIQNILLGSDFPWFFNNIVVRAENRINLEEHYNYQFTHTLYRDYAKTSDLFHPIVDPIFTKLNPSAILRVKANLIPRADKNVMHEYHKDIDLFRGKTAIFYLNTNNGKTYFEDGTEVDAIENRIVVFDSNILHTGSTCTDQKARIVLNLNYYEWIQE